MKKQMLLIDDERDFKVVPADWDVVVARTSHAALTILEEGAVWDGIWFDHDLGMVDGKVDTTRPVVDFLAEKAFNDEPVQVDQVFVHTANNVGARMLMTTLERYGYAPRRVTATDFFSVGGNEKKLA